MREQPTSLRTGKNQRIIIICAFVVLLVGLTVFWVINATGDDFTPPDFDKTAAQGVPEPDESFSYGEVSAENGFKFSVAANIYQQEDGSVILYLTNPENSGYVLLGEIADKNGKILYKSGAINPGSYVERLQPMSKMANEAVDIVMNVYAFEPDTWYSMGTITLRNTLQPW